MKKYFYFSKNELSNSYSDLAIERRRADTECEGVEYSTEKGILGTWETVKITSREGEISIGRPSGIYETFNTGRMDLLNYDQIDDAKEEVSKKLCSIFDRLSIWPERLLVIGLGNSNLTPDSIGPKAASNVKATAHIKKFDEAAFDSLECSEIGVLTPGVMADSGIQTSEIAKGVCSVFKPNAVIAIDAITAGSVERLGSTIQISDTGIIPGSGVGNLHEGLNEQILGAPVIAIGIPTVVDSRVFATQNTSYNTNVCKPAMLVSPKEIDEIVNIGAEIIAGGINQAFGICAF